MSYHTEYYKKRRLKYIEMLGGKCVCCGSADQLEFDHINQSDKNFSIGKLLNYSEEKVLVELAKCQLLCKTCHKIKTSDNKDHRIKILKGEEIYNAILTDDIVRLIKKRRREGATLTVLVFEFGYKKSTINAIISGKTWKHIIL